MAQDQRITPVLKPAIKPTLGLLGATVNAMALIAPGAFLWITYQLQAAATAPSGASVAGDMWAGIVLALFICFLTAISYAQLAKLYPEAGFASVTYFAERAFLESKGTPIGPYDLLIAAQARRREAVLVTLNRREFERVPRLMVTDWLT